MIVLLVGAGLAVGLVLLGAMLAGAPAPVPQDTRPGTAAAPRDVNIIMRDYHFDPTPLYLYRGETVRLNVVNAGMVEHELVLGDNAAQSAWSLADAVATPPAAFATAPPASVAPGTGGLRVLLQSGESESVEYQVPSDVPIQVMCHLPGHLEKGMVGAIVMLNP